MEVEDGGYNSWINIDMLIRNRYTSIPASEVMGIDNNLVLRLIKEGSRYTAYYSSDGEQFTELGTADIILKEVHVGIMAIKGHKPSLMFSFFEQEKAPDPAFSPKFLV